MTRHCWKCGTEWGFPVNPGRGETCAQCRADLRCCVNCVSYDRAAAHQCRDRRADPELDKHAGNFCEYFEFVRRKFTPPGADHSRESAAREQMRKLFGD
jgi:hypothetical protein